MTGEVIWPNLLSNLHPLHSGSFFIPANPTHFLPSPMRPEDFSPLFLPSPTLIHHIVLHYLLSIHHHHFHTFCKTNLLTQVHSNHHAVFLEYTPHDFIQLSSEIFFILHLRPHLWSILYVLTTFINTPTKFLHDIHHSFIHCFYLQNNSLGLLLHHFFFIHTTVISLNPALMLLA